MEAAFVKCEEKNAEVKRLGLFRFAAILYTMLNAKATTHCIKIWNFLHTFRNMSAENVNTVECLYSDKMP